GWKTPRISANQTVIPIATVHMDAMGIQVRQVAGAIEGELCADHAGVSSWLRVSGFGADGLAALELGAIGVSAAGRAGRPWGCSLFEFGFGACTGPVV